MKKYLQTVTAACLGSALTLAASFYTGAFQPDVVTLTKAGAGNQKPLMLNTGSLAGEEVSVDFTTTADQVLAGVVHIKSTYGRPVARGNPRSVPRNVDPFRQFFGDGFDEQLRQGP